MLKAAGGTFRPYANDELEALARHCTEAEDAAKKVERQVAKSAAAILLETRIGEQFDAIVTGASDKGTWVRLPHPPIEGRLESGVRRSGFTQGEPMPRTPHIKSHFRMIFPPR